MPSAAPSSRTDGLPSDRPAGSLASGWGLGAIGWPAVFLLSFALYALTANRGIQWQDSGHRILRVVTGDLTGDLGLALSHPLHHWLGRLAVLPGWNPALAVTLVSALAGALAVANVFGCVLSLTHRGRAALFAAASLALAHTFWQMATLTETYTITAALLAGELWCLAVFLQRGSRRAFAGMFLLNGLGVANHLLAGLTTPVLLTIAAMSWRDRKVTGGQCALAGILWLAGSLPYAGLVVAEWISSGDLAGTLRSALFGTAYARNVLNTELSTGMLARGAAFVLYNFPNLLLPAAFLGIARAARGGAPRRFFGALLAALLIHAGFVLRYNIKDQQTFFLPLYVILSIFGGMGAGYVLAWPASTARRALGTAAVLLLAATPAVYAATPPLARRLGLLDGYPRRPYRDNYVYLFIPWSIADRSAEQMSEQALALAGPDGVVFYEDRMAGFALRYKAILSQRTALTVSSIPPLKTPDGRDRFRRMITRPDGTARPVVFVPTDVEKGPDQAAPAGRWHRRGDLYVLRVGNPASRATGRAS